MRELVAVVEKVHNGRENADEMRKEQSKNQILTGLLLSATAGKEEPRMPLRSLDAVEEDKKLRGNKGPCWERINVHTVRSKGTGLQTAQSSQSRGLRTMPKSLP